MNIYIYRLQQLSDSLRRCSEYGWKFSIKFITSELQDGGCAIGLCAKIWPERFQARLGYIIWPERALVGMIDSYTIVKEFFGLDGGQVLTLFSIGKNPGVTAEEVANNIDKMIAPYIVTPVQFLRPEPQQIVEETAYYLRSIVALQKDA